MGLFMSCRGQVTGSNRKCPSHTHTLSLSQVALTLTLLWQLKMDSDFVPGRSHLWITGSVWLLPCFNRCVFTGVPLVLNRLSSNWLGKERKKEKTKERNGSWCHFCWRNVDKPVCWKKTDMFLLQQVQGDILSQVVTWPGGYWNKILIFLCVFHFAHKKMSHA